jgi:hypothetical protein
MELPEPPDRPGASAVLESRLPLGGPGAMDAEEWKVSLPSWRDGSARRSRWMTGRARRHRAGDLATKITPIRVLPRRAHDQGMEFSLRFLRSASLDHRQPTTPLRDCNLKWHNPSRGRHQPTELTGVITRSRPDSLAGPREVSAMASLVPLGAGLTTRSPQRECMQSCGPGRGSWPRR